MTSVVLVFLPRPIEQIKARRRLFVEITRARSEAGLSRLPVTEEIAGSNPVGPAKPDTTLVGILPPTGRYLGSKTLFPSID
jgi:hypothetical protein